MRKRGLVAGLTTVITLAMLISGCSSNNAAAMEELRQQYPPPGQMVKVNGLDIHFNVRGEGSLTVVMESGLGENSLTWERVAPIVAQSTRVVVYDRPGQGWSQPTTSPRTIDVFTSELHEALGQAGISGPYILVGQGMGGLAMRLFTQKYPGEVAGLVLIDTPLATEEARYAAVVDTFSTKRSREAIVKSYQDMVKLASNGTLARDTESIPVGKGLPDATRKTYQALVAAYPGYWTMTAAEYENEATDLVQAQQLRPGRPAPGGDLRGPVGPLGRETGPGNAASGRARPDAAGDSRPLFPGAPRGGRKQQQLRPGEPARSGHPGYPGRNGPGRGRVIFIR
jgi:pimeloyl-ACP methyl ester carboxylesterase